MTLKYKILLAIAALSTSFAFGRYSAPQPPSIKETEKVKEDVKTDTAKDIHETTRTETTKEPSGKVVTVVTETKDTIAKTDTDKQVDMSVQLTQTPPKLSTINISALIGVDASHDFKPAYGIAAQKQFVGPITLGAFGLTSGVVGISVGLNF